MSLFVIIFPCSSIHNVNNNDAFLSDKDELYCRGNARRYLPAAQHLVWKLDAMEARIGEQQQQPETPPFAEVAAAEYAKWRKSNR
jgi:hypothetical protein